MDLAASGYDMGYEWAKKKATPQERIAVTILAYASAQKETEELDRIYEAAWTTIGI